MEIEIEKARLYLKAAASGMVQNQIPYSQAHEEFLAAYYRAARRRSRTMGEALDRAGIPRSTFYGKLKRNPNLIPYSAQPEKTAANRSIT